jgi:hypothetical protein
MLAFILWLRLLAANQRLQVQHFLLEASRHRRVDADTFVALRWFK